MAAPRLITGLLCMCVLVCGNGNPLTLALSSPLSGRLFLRWQEVQDSHLPSNIQRKFLYNPLAHLLSLTGCNTHNEPCSFRNFFVEIAMIEFAILHTVFKLLFSCFLQDVSEGIAKINYPHFLPLCRANFVLMGGAIVADTPADCQTLFLKVDVLPSKSCNFPKPKPCEIRYLYGQDCVFTPLSKLCNQLLVLFIRNMNGSY